MEGEKQECAKGWIWETELGSGGFGSVHLATHVETKRHKVVKFIRAQDETVKKMAENEIAIHSCLHHENVIAFHTKSYREMEKLYLIELEYAGGGTLLDRLELDVGIPHELAQRYFKQLLCGVEYLHKFGVVHRDLKPENLFLDKNDTLKIGDFGLAVEFRYRGQEYALTGTGGTRQYMAPEVLSSRTYSATPTDIWACGVVLITMLAGWREWPWARAELTCDDYNNWLGGDVSSTPWTRIDRVALSLLKRILSHNPRDRATIADIRSHTWMNGDDKARKQNKFKRICTESFYSKRAEMDDHTNHASHKLM